MKKALVIDDNEMFRDSVEVMLDELGFAATALASFDDLDEGDSPYDLVMCDLMMPTDLQDEELGEDEQDLDDQSVMVGVHALRTLSQKYPQAVMIAMSGIVDPQILRSMSTFGAQVTLKKPFDLDELESALRRAEAS